MHRWEIASILLGLQIALCSCAQTKSFDITSVIQNHFAETTLESEVLNDQNTSAEIAFQIMLPQEAFITHFEMIINETTYEGVIEEKEQAKKKFNEAKRRGQTAGLVETRQKAEKVFKTSVNIGAKTAVKFKLVYQQLLRKLGGKYKNKIVLFGDQLSEFLNINVYICEPRNLKNVTVPPILLNNNLGTVAAQTSVFVNRNTAQISFAGNDQSITSELSANGGVFAVEYELESTDNPVEVIVDNGYFIYFGPDIEITPKSMIFVLDDSGSMSGQKSEQVKRAMGNILSKLLPTDLFTVVKFSSSVRPWKKTLTEATPAYIESAKTFVRGSDESGGTEIWKALEKSLEIMDRAVINEKITPDPYSNMIILLSDGEGSLGNAEVMRLVEEANRKRFGIHTISFGSSADDDLLKSLADENHGKWKKILVDLNSALQIENYIDEIRAAEAGALQVIRYPEIVTESFSVGGFGGEVMSVGKFQKEMELLSNGPYDITYEGSFDGNPSIVQATFYLDQEYTRCGGMGASQIQNFAAKTYAMAEVQAALKALDAADDPDQKALLKQKAINVSLEHKLVTPVTSLLVIKPEQDNEEDIDESLISTTAAPTTTTRPIRTTSRRRGGGGGGGGGGGRGWSFHSDPHFLATLSDGVTVCFTYYGRNNEVVNLLNDVDRGIVINGLIKGFGRGLTRKLFVTKMMFMLIRDDIYIEIDTEKFVVGNNGGKADDADRVEFSLIQPERQTLSFGILKLEFAQIKPHHIILNVRVRKVLFVVEIHHRNETRIGSQDHLDLVIPDYESGTRHLGGIFGHLQTGNVIQGGADARIEHDEARNRTFLLYNNDKIRVKKWQMKVPIMRSKVDCWLTKGHFQHLLGSKLRNFKLSSLMEIPGQE